MRMKSNLKKVLSIILAASVVTTTSALAGLAAGGANDTTTRTLSLLPTSLDQVTPVENGQEGNVTISMDENGKLNTTAAAWSWPTVQVTYDQPLEIDIVNNPILTYVIGGDGGEAEFVITYSGKDAENKTFSACAYYGIESGYMLQERQGTIDLGAYLAERDRIPDNGIITISQVTLQTTGNNASGQNVGATNIWETLDFGPAATDPATGAPATPDAPFHEWAAESMPENVEVGVNLLDKSKLVGTPANVTFNEDGSMSYSATAWSAFSLKDWTINLEENPYLYWSIEQPEESSGTFAMYSGSPWLTSRDEYLTESGEYFNNSGSGVPGAQYLYGNETGCFNMYEWYKANGSTDLAAKKITELKFYTGAEFGGDITVNYMFFGPAPTTVTEPTDPTDPTEPTEPTEPTDELFPFDPAAWDYDSSVMQITNGTDGSLVYYNTNSEWPSATYRYETPITIDPEKTSLSYDFTVASGAQSSFLLFLNDCTPEDYNGKDDRQFKPHQYMEGVNIDQGSGDIIGDGNPIKGVLDLSTVPFSDACYNDDGTITINAIRIFAVGAANSEITVRDFSLIIEGEPTAPSETEPSETEPSETEPSDTQPSETDPSETDPSETQPSGTDSTGSVTDTTATTAAPTTGNGGNNSPATGENTALAMIGGLLLIGSAGALILTKKNKAR